MGDAYMGYEDDVREDLLATFTRGMQTTEAMRLIDLRFSAVDGGTPVEDATVNLTDKSLGAIYWYAVNLGKFAGNRLPSLLFGRRYYGSAKSMSFISTVPFIATSAPTTPRPRCRWRYG